MQFATFWLGAGRFRPAAGLGVWGIRRRARAHGWRTALDGPRRRVDAEREATADRGQWPAAQAERANVDALTTVDKHVWTLGRRRQRVGNWTSGDSHVLAGGHVGQR